MNNIDVYDIATSKWYKQATSGPMPNIRVNPCAVTAAAPDGSSTQIYMFGGQNLIPAGNQTQYDDMWILSIPSFNWIKVDQDESKSSKPPARAGHSCHIWDAQMIVVGGYVGGGGVWKCGGSFVSWYVVFFISLFFLAWLNLVVEIGFWVCCIS